MTSSFLNWTRFSPRDRDDIKYLARKLGLNIGRLKERFEKDFQPTFVGVAERLNSSFKICIEMIEEERGSQ